jgi:hypothetical protein
MSTTKTSLNKKQFNKLLTQVENETITSAQGFDLHKFNNRQLVQLFVAELSTKNIRKDFEAAVIAVLTNTYKTMRSAINRAYPNSLSLADDEDFKIAISVANTSKAVGGISYQYVVKALLARLDFNTTNVTNTRGDFAVEGLIFETKTTLRERFNLMHSTSEARFLLTREVPSPATVKKIRGWGKDIFIVTTAKMDANSQTPVGVIRVTELLDTLEARKINRLRAEEKRREEGKNLTHKEVKALSV